MGGLGSSGVWSRVLDGSANDTLTLTNLGGVLGAQYYFSVISVANSNGCNLDGPPVYYYSNSYGNAIASPIATTVNGDLILVAYMTNPPQGYLNGSWTAPAGMTTINTDADDMGQYQGGADFFEIQSMSGLIPPSGNFLAVLGNGAGHNAAYTLALEPFGAPTPAPIAMPTPSATPGPTSTNDNGVIRANDFLNSLGSATHDIQGLESSAAITNGFNYTGLRLGRDDATHNLSPSSSAGVQDLCNIHSWTINAATNPTGVLYDELPIVDVGSPGNTNDANIADTQAEYDYLAGCGAMLQAEGPNEPNNQPFYYEGNLCSGSTSFLPCAQYMQALYQMVKSDPALRNFPVVGISEVGAEPDDVGLQFLTIPSGADTEMPAGTAFGDIANAHNYVQGNGSAGEFLSDNQARLAESIQPGDWDAYGEYWGPTWGKGYPGGSTGQSSKPKVTTETGWNVMSTPNVSADAQGRLMTDVYLDGYQLGWSQTFIYLMFNEPNNLGWGMFNLNGNEADAGNATPAGRYVHNLTTILSDNSSAFTPTAVIISVSNLPSTGYYQLMEKSSGTYELVLWGEAFASKTSTPVTVNLPNAYSTVNVYDVVSGALPINSYSNANSVTVNLTDHAVIVEF